MKKSLLKSISIALTLIAYLLSCTMSLYAQNINSMKTPKKILFVVTSHDKKGATGQPTGFFLSEVTHPWKVLHDAGYEIDFVSPQGGKAPVDGFNLKDEINKEFWDNTEYHAKIEHMMKPSEVNPAAYSAIFYAGGHGTMWDFADNADLAVIAAKIYENQGVIGAVCHGPSGLINIKLSNGNYLIEGKRINAFTNEEENAVGLSNVVPYSLEDKLKERGAKFEKSAQWQVHVAVDQRVVTGQNPQSAHKVGEAILSLLNERNLSTNINNDMNASIHWPERFMPGKTDNYVSNEIIVSGITAEEVWKYIVNTSAWPKYYSNVSDIHFYNSPGPELFLNAHFKFTTFTFLVEAEVTEFVPPADGKPARIAWHGWAEGDAETALDVHHAWLFENLPGNRVRILTQETQIGKPAQDMAKAKPNPMLNAHQEWIEGLARAAQGQI